MKTTASFAAAAAVAAIMAAPASAQTALTGIDDLEDRIEDIEDETRDDFRRGEDKERFSGNKVLQGWRGSLALTGSSTSGNTDTADLSIAGRLTYGVGDWNHTFGIAAEFGQENNVRSEENIFAVYEGNRYFTPQFYVFGIARFEFDGVTNPAAPAGATNNQKDGFLGFGPGYRFINTPKQTWRVQAGPGVRYFEDVNSVSETEAGFIATSRFYHEFSDTLALTNDTEVLGSSINTLVTNDLGFNVKLSETLSTRVSYRTEYNTDPVGGRKSTDNRLGVSLVLGF